MLRLLLFLSALSCLKFAAAEFEAEENLTTCSITYYGDLFAKLYLKSTADRLIICLTGKHDTVAYQDCIFAPPLPSDTREVHQYSTVSGVLSADFKNNLASIPDDAEASCALKFEGGDQGEYVLSFMMFGQQTALQYKTPEEGIIEFMVNNVIVDTVNSSDVSQYIDLTGCRSTGQMFKPGADFYRDNSTCSASICSSTGNFDNTNCNADLDRCQSNGFCILDPVCSVIGPSVISVKGAIATIPDRCTYTLMSDTPISGLSVLGKFMERRREDVYFLDSVILVSGSSESPHYVHLVQGSRVWVDDEEVTLNSTVQTIVDVELSKTEAGVTVRVSKDGYTVTVFFDDYTAQISMTGETGGGAMRGLCYSPSAMDDFRNTNSTDKCQAVPTDIDDFDHDSNAVNERCSVLEDEPFTVCHTHIGPRPFIQACEEALGMYPAVDSLPCQFIETYTRICSERSGETLEDWRPDVDCPSPRAFCQGRVCAENEFCAETISGNTGCFCRAIYASSYRSTDTWGDPMVCNETSGSVTLLGCFLEENGINYSTLQLSGENCEGEIDQVNHKVTFSFDSSNTCGTEVKTNNSHMIFENTITNQQGSTINRDYPVEINISCTYPLPDDQTMGFRIKDNSVVKQITTGVWNYNLTMEAYTNEQLTQAVDSSEEIELNEKIWVKLDTEGLDDGFVALVTDSCWATNQDSSDGDPRHDLFNNGCANTADQTVEVYGNGQGMSNRFSFNMFEFTGLSNDIYLHCKVNLCAKLDGDCVPDCNPDRRRRRSPRFQYTDEASALITLVWTQ